MRFRPRSRFVTVLLACAALALLGVALAMTRPAFRSLASRAAGKADSGWEMVQAVYFKRNQDEGKRLYLGHCSGCHGAAGEGGRGPALARKTLPRAGNAFELYGVVSDGISGSEMPGYSWMTTDRERWLMVAYTRSLGEASAPQGTGDRARGEKLFFGKGTCVQCHAVGARGGTIGPDLSSIGSQRGLRYLRDIILHPEAMPVKSSIPVRVVTADGRRIEGVRVREDTFSIQIRELSGRFHSFWISELKSVEKDSGKSLMPSYRKAFTDAECDDVVAYLASLRSE